MDQVKGEDLDVAVGCGHVQYSEVSDCFLSVYLRGSVGANLATLGLCPNFFTCTTILQSQQVLHYDRPKEKPKMTEPQ